MAPPTAPLNLDVEAISGICGSISIACWVVVFSPQILENFRRGSADGLSLHFIIVWLIGDVFNILGAVLQGVLPTMVCNILVVSRMDTIAWLQELTLSLRRSSWPYITPLPIWSSSCSASIIAASP